jgi:hypothetical protein
VRALPTLYREWAATGMVANIGARIAGIGAGTLALEADLVAEKHGFPTSNGTIVRA